jgi:hypothetical protein
MVATMSTFFKYLFIQNWLRKTIACFTAIVIWLLVNHSITTTRTLPNVPVRIVNLPKDKTVEGLLPNGTLSKKWTVVLTGKKSLLQGLTASDLELVIDAAGKGDRWVTEISKKALFSPNPDIDFAYGISEVSPFEITMQLIPIVTEKIPIVINPPVGTPPKGYRYLDVSHQPLYQTVKGPQNKVQELLAQGISLTFDLTKIDQAELEKFNTQPSSAQKELPYLVPAAWKQISIPFGQELIEDINDPQATLLHLNFLKDELLPLVTPLPINIFYPVQNSSQINPETHPLQMNELIREENGIYLFIKPLCMRNVSPLFVEVIRQHLSIVIVAAPQNEGPLEWNLQLHDPDALENAYVEAYRTHNPDTRQQEILLRARFQKYAHDLELVHQDGEPLKLKAELLPQAISLKE